ncbi:hypothetical protein LOCC1_G002578 [Lachnellula occidentalis]|uniref:Rhodopsin domain-containing protein n=1 Tax=Lachnellula occidentalis TaxID=215460 RepID=A0A8H8S7R9_9HELO|nr:hypothetical protein LOCC1_G002578 [Lachnellula occidentalis]
MAQDRAPELAAVYGLFLGLTWLFVALRVYVKSFLSKSWGTDDYLLVVSLILFTTYSACSLAGIKYGTGRHTTDIPPQDIPKALFYWWLCELLYTITIVFVRLSIAVILLRIGGKPVHKIIIYTTLTMMLAYSIFYSFLVIFQCSPISFFWAQFEGLKGTCIKPTIFPAASITHSAVNFTSDWILGLLPIALIWNLRMNRRTKVSVAAVLSLGVLAGIAAIIRIPYIHVLGLTEDFLFNTIDIAIWSTVEPGLGIVAASAATLRPLFRNFYSLPTARSSHSQKPTHAAAGQAGYVQQSNQHDVSTHRRSNSASTFSGNIELQPKMHTTTTTTSIRSKDPFGDLGERENGRIQVERTVEITRSSEYEDQFGILEEPHALWPRGKDERDMV